MTRTEAYAALRDAGSHVLLKPESARLICAAFDVDVTPLVHSERVGTNPKGVTEAWDDEGNELDLGTKIWGASSWDIAEAIAAQHGYPGNTLHGRGSRFWHAIDFIDAHVLTEDECDELSKRNVRVLSERYDIKEGGA